MDRHFEANTAIIFEFLSRQLSDEYLADARKIWTEDFIDKNDDYCYHNIIQMFKKIQMVHFAQSYEIKFKILQKRQDRQVKKKR